MNKNKSKLEPCPFCGSDAELIEDIDQFCVRCTQCNASTDYFDTQLDAVVSWDDRSGYNRKRIFRLLLEVGLTMVFYFIILGIVSFLMR